MSLWDHTQCPYCCADNLPQRDACWQCGKDLPHATAPDGVTRVRVDPTKTKLTEADLQRLLTEAETYDMGTSRKRSWFGADAASGDLEPAKDPCVDANSGAHPHHTGITWLKRLRGRHSQA